MFRGHTCCSSHILAGRTSRTGSSNFDGHTAFNLLHFTPQGAGQRPTVVRPMQQSLTEAGESETLKHAIGCAQQESRTVFAKVLSCKICSTWCYTTTTTYIVPLSHHSHPNITLPEIIFSAAYSAFMPFPRCGKILRVRPSIG